MEGGKIGDFPMSISEGGGGVTGTAEGDLVLEANSSGGCLGRETADGAFSSPSLLASGSSAGEECISSEVDRC